MKCVCYYRHSTDNKKQDENSIERQQDLCRRHCLANGWEIIEEVIDKNESGTSDKQNLELLKKRVKEKFRFDILVVDDLARFTRKDVLAAGEDFEFLRTAKIKISIVATRNGTPLYVDELARDISQVVKGWANHEEVRDTARKVASGMLAKFKSGRLGHMGPTPFGFKKITPWDPNKGRDDQEPAYLVANSDLAIAREVFLHVLNGGTIRSCIPILEKAQKYQSKDGKQRYPCCSSVKHILRNAIYCGIETFGVRDAGKWETASRREAVTYVNENPLVRAVHTRESNVEKAVSYSEFCDVQDILDQNKKKKRPRPATAGHRYSSILKCGACGGMMIAHRRKPKQDVEIVDYRCPNSNSSGSRCRHSPKPWAKSVCEKDLDEKFSDFFGQCNLNSGFHASVVNTIIAEIQSLDASTNQAILKDELAKLEVEEQKLRQAYERLNEIPDWIYQKQNEISAKKRSLQENNQAPMTLCEAARLEYESTLKTETPQRRRYLANCWLLAQKIVTGQLDPQDLSKFQEAIEELVDESFLASGQSLVWLVDEEGCFEQTGRICEETGIEVGGTVVGVTYPDPNDVLAGLRDMGLKEVTVNWSLATKRGKPKQTMSQLEFSFVGYNNHTLMGVFSICNQTPRLEIRFERR